MVNVGHKPVQRRRAVAEGRLFCRPATIRALKRNALPKGNVLTVAQIAGIQAAKRAGELIPLCHPLALNHVEITFRAGPPPSRWFARQKRSRKPVSNWKH